MNRFKVIEEPLPKGQPLQPLGAMNITQGLRRDLSPREIPLEAATREENLRFEKSAIRKDYGDRILPGPNMGKILTIVEHKFIDSGRQFSRIIRAARGPNGELKTQLWNPAIEAWEDDVVSTEIIEERYIRAISTQGVLLFAAKGQPVMVREETITVVEREYDFPAGNSLTDFGEKTSADITPLVKLVAGTVIVRYDLEIDLTAGDGVTVWVAIKKNDIEVIRHSYTSESGDPQPKQFSSTNVMGALSLKAGDTVDLEVVDVVPDSGEIEQSLNLIFNPDATVDEQTAGRPNGDPVVNNLFRYLLEVQTGTSVVRVDFYADTGGGWVKVGDRTYQEGFNSQDQFFSQIMGTGAGTKFGIKTVILEFGSDPQIDGILVDWTEEGSAAYTFSVHGLNKATDLDPNAGVELDDETGLSVTLEPIAGAPEALWIEPFADRVIALRDGVDSQVFSWTVDGNVLDWASVDSGQIFLVDARNDPLDDLQAAAPLSSNILAVFRSRSIMRAFETGSIDQSVGVVHWIENIGTESPWSVQATPGGICFLGHDLMVYMLTESGPVPIGQPIHQELVERVTGNLQLVDAEYDPVFQDYYLGVPEENASIINRTYIFDVGSWFRSGGQTIRWRSRSGEVQRYSVVSEV